MPKQELDQKEPALELEEESVGSSLPKLFSAAARKAGQFLSSLLRGVETPHADFGLVEGQWFCNKQASASFQFGYQPEFKVVFFFNQDQLTLLNDCPFPAKFAVNREEPPQHDFIGIAYPELKQKFSSLEAWASQFSRAEVFTYGEFIRGEWHSEHVRDVSLPSKSL